MMPDILTVAEVARLMRVSRDTVYRLAARGELPGRKIGRIWRFLEDDIEQYLRKRPQAMLPTAGPASCETTRVQNFHKSFAGPPAGSSTPRFDSPSLSERQ